MRGRTPEKILLSSGGTGGHMAPAAALGRDLECRGYAVALATDTRGLKFREHFGMADMHVLRSGTLAPGLAGKISGAFNLGLGYLQARRLLIAARPRVVVGFGGYPSVPAVLAAQHLNIPTVLHEQNAVLGRANMFLAGQATRIALSMPLDGTRGGLSDDDAVRAVVTGNPVRHDIAALFNTAYPALSADGTVRILVIGGSQGARVFADVVPAALALLGPEHKARLEVAQQCREEDLERVRAAYDEAGIRADLEAFFGDVPQRLEKCHLVITRAGASTISEVTVAGRPAIFVPNPNHADQQQKINAESVADAGGAWVMPQPGFTAEALAARVETFLHNPQTLFRAAEAARSLGRPDAARRLGNLVTALASGWDERG